MVSPQAQAPLVDHSVVIQNGRIIDVLPRSSCEQRYTAKMTRDLEDHVLMPGLVNAHTHNGMTFLRGIADDTPLMVWLQEHIWPREAKHAGPAFVKGGCQLAMAEMIKGG